MRRTPRPDHSPDAPPRPGNLPHELNRFVGRAAELAALQGALETGRLVTVTGVGGVGKSRFAAHAAALTPQDLRPDGVWRVELAAVRREELVEYALAETLGLTDHTTRPPRQVLVDHLAERSLVLVLDGFEQLVDACASLVRDLLRAAPGLRVVAVGRRPLALDGERLFPLAPLTAEDAAELFTERAAALLPDFALDDGNRGVVLEVCKRLDCLPLAMELAAGRLRALSPAQLVERLDDRFRLLTGGGRDALPRHQTLRTTIGWSHELCTPQERLLWARLSAFSGSFDLEAAEYICSGDGLHADDVLDVLHELLDQSVVTREESASGVRYWMLDTVRAYGAEWLDGLGDTERMRRRHRDWYMGLATWCELDWFSPRQCEVAARTDAELPNLRAALEFCLTEPGETHLGQYLAGTLWFFWAGCGRLAEGRHWLDRSVELDTPGAESADTASRDSRLKALWVLGYVAILQGDAVPALAALQECRDAAEDSGDMTALAYAVHRTGCLALVTDDMPRAEHLLRDSLARYREIGELNSNVLMGQVELAMTLAFQGELAQAVALCDEVRQVCEDHGERWTRAYALYVLAYARWTQDDAAAARLLLEECLIIGHEFHDLLGTVLAMELLALVTAVEGDADEAAVLQGAAARIWPSVGLPLFGSAYYNEPHEVCEARAREALGDVRFEELARVGERLGHDEAVARALRGGARKAAVTVVRPARAVSPEKREPAASPTANGGETTG
ncbi:AAA family ATPase [Streptomyces sp. VRA16 Mangrove soil]|uniref:ATP-binding protein n=1 Tax=Streptomyces sp. VRA16 Mangrove soil TaxID=2817434 RepID=UPI001A9EFDB2|nr:AAA family ATPase [Streptomyces sp. VRA16 Mangrove soil]MBO1331617.1 regulator [Streptomyces sp. VRA16 Mangrove soil]